MTIELSTVAERKAQMAESSVAFGGVNLLHIKRQVAHILSLIGRNSIFDQYTKHDISHVDEMLRLLDMLIPERTKEIMSDADWLMVVLAIYFHDLGMLVTQSEYEARNNRASGFASFCEQQLFSGKHGADYRAKVEAMNDEVRDRFLYQEFVRYKHGERVRAWVAGHSGYELGEAGGGVVEEIGKLLEPLGPQFRRDLGIVCESHHLDDLGDTGKYKVSQPYGNSQAETVNLQYCAVLLRTADLFHITSDRTPSIEFRIINPTDPLSQQEWAKQMAVKSVRPKCGVNEDGQLDEAVPRDTLEVHAYFTKEDGFFGLTSYLAYAADQLKKSNAWILQSGKSKLVKHEFPWRRIDDSNIETAGFLRDAFEFTLDQAKILDLLTGHTLYNDTSVVLRELVQNAIDAIRLYHHPSSPKATGCVEISWNTVSRTLSVRDNGTGMTQDIINNFLLKVGSSRYQDPEFKKNNPEFSSISRFGIGVLSAFMIADNVEVVSCHPDEEKARRLSLRSVHGKYLISLLEKSSDEVREIGPHGTLFKLHVRPSVDMSDVVGTAKRWIVIPDCKVTVQVDDGEVQQVGFDSPAEALRAFLRAADIDYEEDIDESSFGGDLGRLKVRIVERRQDGVDLAYALTWDRWFKEWSFLTLRSLFATPGGEKERPRLGTCVEGVRIVSDTPGFEGYPIVAIANVRGASAPKTNVARSGLEATHERDSMLRTVYGHYANHIATELSELAAKRSFSPTWAVGETEYLLQPLLRSDEGQFLALNPSLLGEALNSIPCVMVEQNGKRSAMSPKALSGAREFWTIDCGLLSSAESLIREVTSDASLSGLVKALNVAEFEFPNAPVVCGQSHRSSLLAGVFSAKEVDRVVVNTSQRRVDLRWVDRTRPTRWCELPDEHRDWIVMASKHRRDRTSPVTQLPHIPRVGIQIDAPEGLIAVRAFGSYYLVPGSEIASFAGNCIGEVSAMEVDIKLVVAVTVLKTIGYVLSGWTIDGVDSVRRLVQSFEDSLVNTGLAGRIEDAFDFEKFATIMIGTEWKSFDTWAWKRNRSPGYFDY